MIENGISLVRCMSPPIGEDPNGDCGSPFPTNYNTGMDRPQQAFLRGWQHVLQYPRPSQLEMTNSRLLFSRLIWWWWWALAPEYFLHPSLFTKRLLTLLTVKYSLRYLLFILYSTICKYTCVNTRKSFRASIQEKLHQNVWSTWRDISTIAKIVNRPIPEKLDIFRINIS